MYELYWYQKEAIQALFDFFNDPTKFLPDDFPGNPHLANPVLALPTGSGKSIVIAEFSRIVLTNWPGQRIMMLTHVKELIEQNGRKLVEQWPQAPLGIFSAGLGAKEAYHPIVFGGVQSVANAIAKNENAFGHRDLIIIDEAHLLSPKDTSQYQKVIKAIKEQNPYLRVIGLTATPYRMRHGMITDGDGLFDALAYNLCSMENFNRLILEGKLSPLVNKATKTKIDTSSVSVVAGEYNLKELGLASDEDEITDAAIREALVLGQDRKSWLAFASSIHHAENIAECLNFYGVPAAASHSKLSIEENDRRIAMFKSGELRALVNNNKLTTGFDHPPVDLIIMLRPTLSPGLWVQMLGRGTRPYPGKDNCLATGTLILTDKGLVPIEDVTLEMKLWDGVDWVEHCGVIFCGEQEVITYAGITGTPDHKVWTKEGWKTLGQCGFEQTPIVRTGMAEQAIPEIAGHFVEGNPKRQEQTSLCENSNPVWSRDESRTDRGEIQKEVLQTKRGVWDILNAGPLHRFTANDALVSNCLVLDFAGNTGRLGPINDPTIPNKPRKGAPGEAPVKVCPECDCYNHLSVKYCSICGHEFTFETKLTKTASEGELIRGLTSTEPTVSASDLPQITLETHQVSHVLYDTHLSSKVGAKPTLKVTYVTPSGRRFSEWLCFSHIGFMRQRAVGWWLKRSIGGLPIPADTTEAWQNASKLSVPKTIQVSIGGRFPEIVGATM